MDENITQKSILVLEKYGHDVIHVLDRFSAGRSDEEVFQLALHYGLIWLRGFQVTKKSYEEVMKFIGNFLCSEGENIENRYYAMKKKGNTYELVQRFPKSSMALNQS